VEKVREIIFYEDYFFAFYSAQNEKVQSKIDEVLYMITVLEKIPKKFFEHISGTNGVFEIRIELGGNIFRVFCCFDEGKLIVLFNGFQKKSQKTPKKEIEKAEKLKSEYLNSKKENGNKG
jgi:phage-related protein